MAKQKEVALYKQVSKHRLEMTTVCSDSKVYELRFGKNQFEGKQPRRTR